MKKSSHSNKSNQTKSSLPDNICPVCEKETPPHLMACQQCHAEIHHLRGKILTPEEKKETNLLLKQIKYAHIVVSFVYIVSWILIRTFLWS